jgi:uncharacterized protein (TIGR02646 family)
MILVRRVSPPVALLENQGRWTMRYQKVAIGKPSVDWATRTAKGTLKQSLARKSHNKCVYCESMLGKSARPEIEHYLAKTIRPDLVFEWTNLFLACGFCNSIKLDRDHAGVLLKPDDDNGEEYFWLNRDTGALEALSNADTARFTETITLCDLNREALCVERLRLYLSVQRYWLDIRKGARIEDLNPDFAAYLKPTAEHKFAIRSALPPDMAEADRALYHAAG